MPVLLKKYNKLLPLHKNALTNSKSIFISSISNIIPFCASYLLSPSIKFSIAKKNLTYIYLIGPWGLVLFNSKNFFFIFNNFVRNISINSRFGLSTSLVTALNKFSFLVSHLEFLFKVTLFIKGLGFKFILLNDLLLFKIGFSHIIAYKIPKFLKLTVTSKFTKLLIYSSDLEKLCSFCASVRKLKSPEFYKGNGIRYIKEYVPLKVFKKI